MPYYPDHKHVLEMAEKHGNGSHEHKWSVCDYDHWFKDDGTAREILHHVRLPMDLLDFGLVQQSKKITVRCDGKTASMTCLWNGDEVLFPLRRHSRVCRPPIGDWHRTYEAVFDGEDVAGWMERTEADQDRRQAHEYVIEFTVEGWMYEVYRPPTP
jgi:hypothetical protein